jgi:hypothetical protein
MNAHPTETTGHTALARLEPEAARANMPLLLLANPNYFGTAPNTGIAPVLNIAGDTAYEQLGCVGYNATLGRLEAVIAINQDSGYNGGLCTAGSQEYVRFYTSADNGATWQDQGVASFTVNDLPGPKPLQYSVALPVSLPAYWCVIDNLPLVRAILSWNVAPPANTPDFVPVWGNVVNATIQVPGSMFIELGGLLDHAKLALPAEVLDLVDSTQAVPVAPAKALTPTALAGLYPHGTVPPHRQFYKLVTQVSGAPAAKNPLAGLGLNLGSVVSSMLATSGDTSFEQLDCVGLDINRALLAAVVQIKQSSGYNGGPCTAGSIEYVAFWVDWGTGFEYVGTTSFTAHDLAAVPAGGVDYAVAFPVDLASHAQPCSAGPQTATVRAILSWDVAPPSTNPNYVPVWGNQLDALVQIPAGDAFVVGTANIAIIGGIGVADIDTTGATASPGMTQPFALFSAGGQPADPVLGSRQCPFGGQITIQGVPSPGYSYRVMVQQVGTSTPIPVTTPFSITNSFGVPSTVTPSADGFCQYVSSAQNLDNTLAYWESSGDALYYVWLEIADSSYTVLGSTPPYLIQLDNTAPAAVIHIDNGGDCKQFPVGGAPIQGHFVATDLNFGSFSLDTTPVTQNPNEPTTATPTYQATAPLPGDAWSLDLTGMPACGYVVQLWVYDRSIVGSVPYQHNSNYSDVGFCLVDG